MLLQGTTFFQFDKIDDPDQELFAMKMKGKDWPIYNGLAGILIAFKKQASPDLTIFQVTNENYQMVLNQVA
jgi:hypothetical protein